MPDKITVLLADDHSLVRRGFRRMLEDDPSIEVVGEASDGEEAVALAAALQPQVIVMDCAMPGTSGLEATRRILERAPDTAVLMLSMHAEETLVRQALEAGARGYILKSAHRSRPRGRGQAGRRRRDGRSIRRSTRPAPLEGRADHGLTPRELEVLQLICDGLSNREIAAKLDLSVNTVAVHRANIMNTLGVHKTAELVVYAMQHGLVNAAVNRREFLQHGGAAPRLAHRCRRTPSSRRPRAGDSGWSTSPQPPASPSVTTAAGSEAAPARDARARAAPFSTTTATAGPTSCS